MFSSDLISFSFSFSFLLKSDLILIRLDLSPFFQFSSVLNWLFRISSFLFHFLRLFSFSLGFDVAFAIRSIRLIGCSRIIIITIIVIISISICVACRYVELWFMSMNLTWTVIQDCLIVRMDLEIDFENIVIYFIIWIGEQIDLSCYSACAYQSSVSQELPFSCSFVIICVLDLGFIIFSNF